jgi:hypothetical protein
MAATKTHRGVYTIHWSAILAGGFVALASWIFLYALGGAIGLSGAQASMGTWTALYTLVAPIIAFFFGGFVTSRSRQIDSRGDGILHGICVWGFATVIGAVILGSFGAAALLTPQVGADVPTSYFWAVAGSIFCSLLSAMLGASAVSGNRTAESRRQVDVTPPPLTPTTTRREVLP